MHCFLSQISKMKKLAHNVKLSVFAREGEEDPVKVESAMYDLIPFEDLEDEKLKIERTIATGAKDNRIFIFQLYLARNSQINRFLDFLKERLSHDQRELLISQAPTRLDEEMQFFIRIDKRKLMEEDRLWITDGGNCYHIKLTIAAYPANKENGLEIIKNWLS
jgi:RNA binding exosome subunit